MNPRNWLVLGTLPIVLGVTTPLWSPLPPWSSSASTATLQDPKAASKKEVNLDQLAGLSDLQDILDLINDRYVEVPDMELVIKGGIQSALERSHPFNSWLNASDLAEEDPGGASAGMTLIKRGIYASVLTVVPGGPADRAGLRPGEVIRRLNGLSLNKISAWKMQRLTRGPEGTEIEVQRYPKDTVEPVKTILKLETIKFPPLGFQTSSRGSLITLSDLRAGRDKEFNTLLARLSPNQPLILDLRNNSEGTMEVALNIANLLCSEGLFATLRSTNKPNVNLTLTPSSPRPSMKLIVLQDSSTSGVAELLASALKRHGKAKTWGSQTAGLGVALGRIPLSQGGALEIVMERWTGAGREEVDQTGVKADKPIKDFGPQDRLIDFILDTLNDTVQGSKAS